MNMDNTLNILAYYAAGYPQTKISRQTLEVYAQALADCSEEDLKKAMMELLRTKKDFPSVAEIRQSVSTS